MLRNILLPGLVVWLTAFSGNAGANEGEGAPKPAATPEQIRQAQEALRGKMVQMGTNAATGPAATNEMNVVPEPEPPTVKLIIAPQAEADRPPAADAAEAMHRKLEEVAGEERKSRLRPPLTNGPPVPLPATNRPAFHVNRYEVSGMPRLPDETLTGLFSKFTGTNITMEQVIGAASELQVEYRRQGYTNVGIAFSPKAITNGVVTLNTFQAVFPQIVIAGER